jgi:hypothetical protein
MSSLTVRFDNTIHPGASGVRFGRYNLVTGMAALAINTHHYESMIWFLHHFEDGITFGVRRKIDTGRFIWMIRYVFLVAMICGFNIESGGHSSREWLKYPGFRWEKRIGRTYTQSFLSLWSAYQVAVITMCFFSWFYYYSWLEIAGKQSNISGREDGWFFADVKVRRATSFITALLDTKGPKVTFLVARSSRGRCAQHLVHDVRGRHDAHRTRFARHMRQIHAGCARHIRESDEMLRGWKRLIRLIVTHGYSFYSI